MKSPLSASHSRIRLLAGLCCLAIIIVVYEMILDYRKIASEPITSWQKDPSADCAVVLTGGPGRVREGLSLLSRNLVKKMIISGVHPDVDFDDLYSSWIYLGEVDEKDIVLERRSTTTYGNAQQSLPIVEALGCRDVVLVTSQYHMPRAFQTFQASFPPNFPISKHTLATNRAETNRLEIWTEVFKGMFYSLWAY